MNSKKKEGVFVNLLMFIYCGIGFLSILIIDFFFAIVYVIVVIVSFFLVIYFRCTKCPCKDKNCTHFWLGKLAAKFPEKESNDLTVTDNLASGLYILGINFFPFPWLIQNFLLLFSFYLLVGITFLIGPLFACKKCENYKCSMNKNMRIKEATS